MNTFEKMLVTLEETIKTANLNPEDFNHRTRPGREVAVNQAKEALGPLKAQFTELLKASSLGIFVSGPGTANFAEVAGHEADTFTLDAEEVYRNISQTAIAALGHTRTFGVQQFSLMLQSLKHLATELGMNSIDSPQMEEKFCPTDEDVVEHVRNLVRNSSKDELNSLYLTRALMDKVVAVRYTNNTVPVVVLNAVEGEQEGLASLFGKGTQNVQLTGNNTIDKEYVLRTFQTFQATRKTKKK